MLELVIEFVEVTLPDVEAESVPRAEVVGPPSTFVLFSRE